VDIPLLPQDSTAFQWAQHYLSSSLASLIVRRATPACKLEVIGLQILPTVIYRASKASWSLSQYEALDQILLRAYRRILNLSHHIADDMILLPGLMAGMGLRSITDSSQAMKWGAINRTRAVEGPAEEAMRDMMDRYAAHRTASYAPPCYDQGL